MIDRGHIGDTLICFLLFQERHPVRPCSCSLLKFRLAIPCDCCDRADECSLTLNQSLRFCFAFSHRPEGICLSSATLHRDAANSALGSGCRIFFIRTTHCGALMRNLGCGFSPPKTWAKNRPRIGSKSGVEGCKSRRINNKLD